MTDDLVRRLRETVRHIQCGDWPRQSAERVEEAAARIEALEAELGSAADFLALVLWADPGTKEAAARKAARDWWIKYDAANRAALTLEPPHAD